MFHVGLVGPKLRPRGVSDGYPVNIPEPPKMSEEGTQNGKPAGLLDMVGAKRVGVETRRKIRELS